MRIGLISREYPWRKPYGGVGVVTANQARALAEAGHQVTVITISPVDNRVDENIAGVRVAGIPFTPFPWLPRKIATFSSVETSAWSRKVLHALAGEGQLECFDIIESPEMGGEGLAVQTHRYRPPIIVKIHGGASLYLKKMKAYRWYHWPVYFREQKSLLQADGISAVSEQALRDCERHFGLRLHDPAIIPNPVDLSFFSPGHDEHPERFAVLFVGRMDAVKGVDLMPEIIHCTLSRNPDVRFLIAGPDRPVSRQIPQTGSDLLRSRLSSDHFSRVKILGHVPLEHMPQVYQRANVLLAPSRSETLSSACIEAAGCGLAAIGARDTGMESVIVHGETGFLEDVRRPEDFAKRILLLADHPDISRRMGERARRLALERFSFEAVARATEAMYENVIHKQSRRNG